MTQGNAFSHRRIPSGSNASKLRTGRPLLHRKGASSVNLSISKLGSGQVRCSQVDDDRLPEMASSFLNFCAMCERQITVPDNTLLYCSESCRRKDSHKPLSASLSSCSTMPSTTTPPSSPPMSPRIIVAPLTPTRAPTRATQPIRIHSAMHTALTDHDPFEWKPVTATDSRRKSLLASDAWKYLCMFQSEKPVVPVRPSRASFASPSSPPSLSESPSSTPSSLSSNASDYMGNYDSTLRPLPPRHNPSFSGNGSTTKGVELVVPHITVAEASPTDVSNDGAIFPANSGLWDHGLRAKT